MGFPCARLWTKTTHYLMILYHEDTEVYSGLLIIPDTTLMWVKSLAGVCITSWSFVKALPATRGVLYQGRGAHSVMRGSKAHYCLPSMHIRVYLTHTV